MVGIAFAEGSDFGAVTLANVYDFPLTDALRDELSVLIDRRRRISQALSDVQTSKRPAAASAFSCKDGMPDMGDFRKMGESEKGNSVFVVEYHLVEFRF